MCLAQGSIMFLRIFQKKEKGKAYSYCALVESYRSLRGTRQRVVSYLGELTDLKSSGWAQIFQKIVDATASKKSILTQPNFFEPSQVEHATTSLDKSLVSLRGIRLERTRDFGDVWLAWALYRMLGLDELLVGVIDNGREEIPWHVIAAILSIARFCEPTSELHIEKTC